MLNQPKHLYGEFKANAGLSSHGNPNIDAFGREKVLQVLHPARPRSPMYSPLLSQKSYILTSSPCSRLPCSIHLECTCHSLRFKLFYVKFSSCQKSEVFSLCCRHLINIIFLSSIFSAYISCFVNIYC